MTWKVEVRLINDQSNEVKHWERTLEQISANELYHALVAEATKRYPTTKP